MNLVELFTEVYQANAWGDLTTRSGYGSSAPETGPIRSLLPKLVHKLAITTIFDAACGECTWFPLIQFLSPVTYTGQEIVAEIVEANRQRHPALNFIQGDITRDTPPQVDLIICRDVLVHLPLSCVKEALALFKASKSRWLLATTFPSGGFTDITPSLTAWRPLNLRQALGEPGAIYQDSRVYPNKKIGLWRLN